MSAIYLLLFFTFYWNSVQNISPTVDKPEVGPLALGSALQEQERIITMSYTLASEASLKSKLVAGQSFPDSPPLISPLPPTSRAAFMHLQQKCLNNHHIED